MRPQPHAQSVESARVSHHGRTGYIRRSARDGLPACFVLSPANARRLSPSSPRYFGPAVAGTRRAVRISQDHTTWAGAQRRCRWDASPSRPHRAAPSSAATKIPHAPPALERALCTRRAPAFRACALRPSFRPDAAASTASRPANRDDRETPLSSERDEGIKS